MNASIRSGLAASLVWLGLGLGLGLGMFLPGSAVAASAAPATAAPRGVEAFDSARWATLQATLKQPAVLVFSTTDCVHCPVVLQRMGQDIRQRKLQAALLAVVMDQAPGDDDAALLADPHYAGADRLFAFAGQAPAIRYAVDPRWRGVTPYLVFLAPGRPPVVVTGPPSAATVEAWAQGLPRR